MPPVSLLDSNYSKKHWASSQLIKVALGRLHKCWLHSQSEPAERTHCMYCCLQSSVHNICSVTSWFIIEFYFTFSDLSSFHYIDFFLLCQLMKVQISLSHQGVWAFWKWQSQRDRSYIRFISWCNQSKFVLDDVEYLIHHWLCFRKTW